ncbi:MAG: tetratricopeptide repeat protein [Pseudonocardiaceae bacterium]
MEFRLLGPLEAWQGGQPVDLGDRQQRYVLAALLLEANKPVPVDRLTEIVWGPSGHESATKLINGYISRLRRIFRKAEAHELQVDKERRHTRTLRVNVARIDYFRFVDLRNQAQSAQRSGDHAHALTLLREATGLWQGEFLADLDNEGLRLPYQRQLRRIRLGVLHDLALLELDGGDYGSVQDHLYTVVSGDPGNERLAVLLGTAMLAAGDRNGALDIVSRTIMVLRTEGMEITSELRTLQERALRGDLEHRPARLPRDLCTFTGREAELDALLTGGRIANSEPVPPPVMTISGMPGIGKTVLALHTAHLLTPNFSDGQLFVDLHGFTPNIDPLAPGNALGRLLTMLGVPGAAIPRDLEDRTLLYRSKMANTRRLIVLDNAKDEAQVEPLLPGTAGSLVIVTSRRRLSSLDHTRGVHLDPMPPGDAFELLNHIVGSDRIGRQVVAAEDIIELVGRLPLAIRLVAGRLLAHPRWQVQYLADLLRKGALRFTELDPAERRLAVAFYVSYEQLTPEQQRVFRLLGTAFGPDIDGSAVAALADATERDIDGILEILHRLSLIEEAAPGRYRLHDLLRVYAEMLNGDDPVDRDAAISRLLDYYLHAAAAAAATAFPHDRHRQPPTADTTRCSSMFGTDEDALNWLRDEHPSLVAAIRFAAHAGRSDVAWKLACVVWRYLYIRGHLDDWQDILSLALHAARESGDLWGQAQALQQLSVACWRAGDSQEALDLGQQSQQLWRNLGDRHGEADARSALGLAAKRLGRFTEARIHYDRAIDLYLEINDQRGRANVLDNLGDLDERLGFLQSALEHHNAALSILRNVNDRQAQLYVLNNIGSVRQKLGQFDDAIVLHQRALTISEKIEYPHGEAFSLNYLGIVYRAMGELQTAANYHHRALAIARNLGDPTLETDIHNDLGECFRAGGDHSGALENHINALTFAGRTGDVREQARAHHGIGRAMHGSDLHDEARGHWLQAVALYRDLDIPEAGDAEKELNQLDCACRAMPTCC